MQIFARACVFLVATLLLAYLPGKLLLIFLKRKLSPLEDFSLACSVGLVISGIVYWPVVFFHQAHAYVLWPLAITLIFILLFRRRWRTLMSWFGESALHDEETGRRSRDRSGLLLAGIIALGVMMLALLPLYYTNLTWRANGTMRVQPISDVFLHIAIANELKHTVPPQSPVFAGYPLTYHYGMDLTVAMFANATGLDVPDLTLRFVPTLFLILSMLTVYCFARVWLASGYFAAFVVFLVFFGEDFAFIPGWLLHEAGDWSGLYFYVPTVFSLFYINPMLPGLGLLFAGLFCLQRYLREGGGAWLFLSAFLFGALVEVKVFTAVHLMASLGFAAITYLSLFRKWACFKVAALTALLAAPSILFVFLHNRSGADISATFDPLSYVSESVAAMGWKHPFTNVVALAAIALPIYLIGSLGMRCLGIPAIFTALIRPRRDSDLRFLLAVFVVIGAIITLTLRIVPAGFIHTFNNCGWFLVQSKYIAWLFAVGGAQSLYRHIVARGMRPILAGVSLATVIVALSIPASVRHFTLHISKPMKEEIQSFDLETVSAMKFLSRNGHPGDVALASNDLIGPVLALTQCRVPIGYFVISQVPRDDYLRRMQAQNLFWKAWHKGKVDEAFLRDMAVRYLLIDRRTDGTPARIPGITKEVFVNAELTVFKVDL